MPLEPLGLVRGGGSPKLAIGTGDTLFVLWTANLPRALYLSIYDSNLNLVRDSIRVASPQTYGNFTTHFTIDRYNRIHVMWHEGNHDNPDSVAEVFYTRSTDGGYHFGDVRALSDTSDHRHSAFPHAEFDRAGDTLCIAWRDSVSSNLRWDIYGVFSTNGGASWGEPRSIVSTENTDSDPDVLVDPLGRIHLFYHVYQKDIPIIANILYKYSDNVGDTWQIPSSLVAGRLSTTRRGHLVEGCRYDVSNNIFG